MRQQYESKGVGFLALSMDANTGKVKQAADQLGLHMGVAVAEWLVPNDFKVVPSTLLVNAQGQVVELIEGSRDKSFFEEKAAELAGH